MTVARQRKLAMCRRSLRVVMIVLNQGECTHGARLRIVEAQADDCRARGSRSDLRDNWLHYDTPARRDSCCGGRRSCGTLDPHGDKKRKEETMWTRALSALAALAGILTSAPASAQTADKLKVAISQRGFWDSSFLEFAQKEGFLKEANLDVEFFFTEGGGQTLQIINSGSVDVAMSNGLLGTLGAYSKGAPIRVISAQMTGAHELFWYVKSDSPIRSLKDAAENKTVAFSAPGSSSNLVLLALLKQAGSKAKPTATGGLPGTLTSTMTGQIDIGWAVPPFALPELQGNKITILAR